jgi:hypothetical protein
MTMTDGMVPPGALRIHNGQLRLAVRLPWYRSLPISCLESVEVSIAGVPVSVRAVAVPGFGDPVGQAASSEAVWDLRDPLHVTLDASARPGDVVPLAVDLAVRIPYIQQAPGVPLVQRAAARTEATIR